MAAAAACAASSSSAAAEAARNLPARCASTVAPYSVRAREGLPVSVPIHRDELADLKGANLWTVRNLLERLQELGDDDPWAAIGKTRQRLTKKIRDRLNA